MQSGRRSQRGKRAAWQVEVGAAPEKVNIHGGAISIGHPRCQRRAADDHPALAFVRGLRRSSSWLRSRVRTFSASAAALGPGGTSAVRSCRLPLTGRSRRRRGLDRHHSAAGLLPPGPLTRSCRHDTTVAAVCVTTRVMDCAEGRGMYASTPVRPCGAGGGRTHDRRIMRVTRQAGREGHSPAGLCGWLLLLRMVRWLFGTGCGLDADCPPAGTRSEGMPSQLPGLSTVDGRQGRPGCQPAAGLGVGLDGRPAAVRTLGRWEGLPGGEPPYAARRERRAARSRSGRRASDVVAGGGRPHRVVHSGRRGRRGGNGCLPWVR
jgi:Thiolase, C-terminal domain